MYRPRPDLTAEQLGDEIGAHGGLLTAAGVARLLGIDPSNISRRLAAGNMPEPVTRLELGRRRVPLWTCDQISRSEASA